MLYPVESAIVDRLRATRRPGESYSSVILRLVELKSGEWRQLVGQHAGL